MVSPSQGNRGPDRTRHSGRELARLSRASLALRILAARRIAVRRALDQGGHHREALQIVLADEVCRRVLAGANPLAGERDDRADQRPAIAPPSSGFERMLRSARPLTLEAPWP
jgi:hypothetical protein